MKRNIKLLNLIIPLNYTWFWNGIYLIYYLRITNYSGIGLIEGIMIPLGLLIEIPTGVISDLFGKKRTLILAFLLNAFASFLLAFVTTPVQLLFSVMFTVIAGALYSGTADAILYDSLKVINEEAKFEKVLSRIKTISLITVSIASIVGGILYNVNVEYPWFIRSVFLLMGVISCLFLKEPPFDPIKISLKNFINQNKQGFIYIFKNNINRRLILRLLLILSFIVFLTELVGSALPIEFGYNPNQLGVLYAIVPLISALGTHLYPFLKKRFGTENVFIFIVVSIISVTLISPWLTFISISLAILYRSFLSPNLDTLSTDIINSRVESKYRATTLSTFTMIKNLPYAVSIIFIGKWLDNSSASHVSFYLSILFIILFTLLNISSRFRRVK